MVKKTFNKKSKKNRVLAKGKLLLTNDQKTQKRKKNNPTLTENSEFRLCWCVFDFKIQEEQQISFLCY